MKVWRTIDNFFSKEETERIIYDESFKSFTTRWFDIDSTTWYQEKIAWEIAEGFRNLSSAVGIEQWPHDPKIMPLPGSHYDKDEKLYAKTGEFKFPLASAIVYLKIEDLWGGNLVLENETTIVPETGKLVLLAPGVLHSLTKWVSGKRISMNLNFWDYTLR